MLCSLDEFEFVVQCEAVETAEASESLPAAADPRSLRDVFPSIRTKIAFPKFK
jgi:hypothetical protein